MMFADARQLQQVAMIGLSFKIGLHFLPLWHQLRAECFQVNWSDFPRLQYLGQHRPSQLIVALIAASWYHNFDFPWPCRNSWACSHSLPLLCPEHYYSKYRWGRPNLTKSSLQQNFEVCDGSLVNLSYFERFLRADCAIDGPEIASSQNRPFNQPLRLAACCRSKTF